MNRDPARCLLAVLAALSLPVAGCSDDPSTARPPDNPSSPSFTIEDDPAWTLLSQAPEDVELEAGAYGLTANGLSGLVAVIRAPEGFMHFGGWTFVAGEPFYAMGFVTADRVYRDPCGSARHSKYKTLVDPGPAVADLAEALVAQKGATTSKPVPVTVDGHHGLYLEYQVSHGVDVEHCEEHAFDILTTGPGAWYLEASHERAAIWILRVKGERLVLAWVAFPGVTREQMQAMTDMAESARFIEPR